MRRRTLEELVGVALRILFMYLYALSLIRLSGRRSLGAVAPIDIAVTFIMGDMFDDIFWAEIPVATGIVGMTTIALLHNVVSYAGYKSHTIGRIVGTKTSVLLHLGTPVAKAMRRERLREEGLLSALRMQGIERIDEAKEASMEPSGKISVLLSEEHKPVEKRDLPALRERKR